MQLEETIPFFAFEQTIKSCDTKINSVPPPMFATLNEELTPLIHSLHELNKKCGIPFTLYRGQAEWENNTNLSTLVKKIALICQPEEILSLVTLLQENYFCGTNPLLFQIYQVAKQRYPILGEFITSFQMDAHRYQFTPFITAKEAGAIVQSKLKKLNLEHSVFNPPVFHLDQLEEQIRNFQASGQQKALFLINFSHSLEGHYSPLILEKKDGVIRILNSDSVYSGVQNFTHEIVKKLKQLPFNTEIYVVLEARQHDFFSCPIFSIGDIKEAAKTMSQEGISFFDYFQEHARLIDARVRSVLSLPVGMMKRAQSLSKIRTLARTSPTFLRKGIPASLKAYVADRTYISYDPITKIHRKVNMATAIKAARYFQKKLEQVIRASESSLPH